MSPESVTSSDGSRRQGGGAPYGEVTWQFDSHRVVATIEVIQGSLRATSFEVTGQGQVPPELRRLPSDAVVMQALRGHGNPGITTVVYLMQGEGELSSAYPVERAEDPESALERSLERYMRQANARPRARIKREVDEVRQMLANGLSTKVIVEALVTRGASEKTAFRRLKAARSV